MKAACPKRAAILSPKGLTFVIHISKTFGHEAVDQLTSLKSSVRARDIFMIEEKSPVLHELRVAFPCNDIHFIAYPSQFQNALEAADLVDGISIDWELGVANHPESWTVDALTTYSAKIRNHGLVASSTPAWPNGFDDGHITKAAKMSYELSQIQSRCAHAGADAYAAGARQVVLRFLDSSLHARDVGFEVSLDSYDFADNHTDVDRSAACTRKAYGKGARAIYLYGNAEPHLHGFFAAMASMGLRNAITSP